MMRLAQGGFSEAQVKAALHGAGGEICTGLRFDVLRGGVRVGELSGTGSVAFDSERPVMRSASLLLCGEADWFREEIRPVLRVKVKKTAARRLDVLPWERFDALGLSASRLDGAGVSWDDIDNDAVRTAGVEVGWAEFPLGVFVPLRADRAVDQSGQVTYRVEGYDRSVLLQLDRLTAPLFLPRGTQVLATVRGLLDGVGAARVILEQEADSATPADREFPFGMQKLEVVNTLLREIGYDPLHCDASGNFVLRPCRDAVGLPEDYVYESGGDSILALEAVTRFDALETPNVFVAVCSNPDLPRDYRSVWENDLPGSRLSVQNRSPARVVQHPPTEVLMVSSQAELDAINARIGKEATMQAEEQLTFTTSVMPVHGYRNLLFVSHPAARGRYLETAWRIDLEHMRMSHTARKAAMG